MLKSFLPYFLCSIIAINLSAFTVVLQIGLIDASIAVKTISWILTVFTWSLVYIYRIGRNEGQLEMVEANGLSHQDR